MSDEPVSPGPELAVVRREWLERVLDTVRLLGGSRDLDDTLEHIARSVLAVVGFDSVIINVTQPDGRVRIAAIAGMAGATDLLGQTSAMDDWMALLDGAEPQGTLRFYGHDQDQEPVERMASWVHEAPAPTSAGEWHPDDILLAPLWGATGALIGVVSVDGPPDGRHPDLEQRTVLELFAQQAGAAIEAANRRSQQGDRAQLFRTVFQGTPAPTLILDASLDVVAANDAAGRLLGRPTGSLDGIGLLALVDPLDAAEVLRTCDRVLSGSPAEASLEHRIHRADGSMSWVRSSIASVISAVSGTRLAVHLEDVTEARRTIEELRFLADHDVLTGLPNRRATYDRLAALLDRCRPGESVAVLAVSVAGLKAVNATHGHLVGDELLVRVARRLEGAIRPGDTLGRAKGDQFVVVARLVDGRGADRIAERCIDAVRPRFELRSGVHDVGLSVGIVEGRSAAVEPAALMVAAEVALAEAEVDGGGRWHRGHTGDPRDETWDD